MFEAYEKIERAIEFAEENNVSRELIAILNDASETVLECINREMIDEYSFANVAIDNVLYRKTIQLLPF